MYGLRREGPGESVCCPPRRATLLRRSASNSLTTVNVPSTALATSRPATRREATHHPLELDRFTETAAANDAAPVSTIAPTFARGTRRRVLTHEEEVDLSQRIEAGERDALHAFLGSSQAAAPLRALAAELREGRILPTEILRNAEENADGPEGIDKLARMLERAAAGAALVSGQTPGRRVGDDAAKERRKRRRVRLATELSSQRFERSVFDRMSGAL